VTGGGSGIGQAVARLLLEHGCGVLIVGRTEEKLRATWEDLGRPERLFYQACDVTDPKKVEALVQEADRRLGRVDILVNNAGLNIKERTVRELSLENWDRLIRTNLDGVFYCMHAVLPQMRTRRDGVIVTISSVAGKRANPLGGAGYVAAKFGVSGLTHCLGVEEIENNIRCSVIYPGEVDTPILEQRPQPVTAEQRQRILRPEDVAEAVLFVATLPPHVTIPDLIIKPTSQPYF